MAEVDVKKIIKDLGDTNWSVDNEAQMKAVQLLKGLALSDDKLSNKFMVKVDKATTDIAKELLGTAESKDDKSKKKVDNKVDEHNIIDLANKALM